jgi:hypothetical protein
MEVEGDQPCAQRRRAAAAAAAAALGQLLYPGAEACGQLGLAVVALLAEEREQQRRAVDVGLLREVAAQRGQRELHRAREARPAVERGDRLALLLPEEGRAAARLHEGEQPARACSAAGCRARARGRRRRRGQG